MEMELGSPEWYHCVTPGKSDSIARGVAQGGQKQARKRATMKEALKVVFVFGKDVKLTDKLHE